MEWTQQLVATQKQRTERIRKETENMKAILDAERGRQVEAIKTTQHIEQVILIKFFGTLCNPKMTTGRRPGQHDPN